MLLFANYQTHIQMFLDVSSHRPRWHSTLVCPLVRYRLGRLVVCALELTAPAALGWHLCATVRRKSDISLCRQPALLRNIASWSRLAPAPTKGLVRRQQVAVVVVRAAGGTLQIARVLAPAADRCFVDCTRIMLVHMCRLVLGPAGALVS